MLLNFISEERAFRDKIMKFHGGYQQGRGGGEKKDPRV